MISVEPMQVRIAGTLERMIRNHELKPGQRLLEVRVAEAFGVSRSPARLALEALGAQRLLRRGGGRGYVVNGRHGTADGTEAGLGNVLALVPTRRAPRIFESVERELATRVLFRSVRLVEERLAEEFGVSRTIARDVLTRMTMTGLVSKDRSGRWRAVRVTPQRIRDLYQLRWALEPEALVSAGPHVDQPLVVQVRDRLTAAIAELPHVSGKQLDQIEADLHITVLARCPNPELLRTLRNTHMLLISSRYMLNDYLPIDATTAAQGLQEHLGIVDLFLATKFNKAAQALKTHLQNSVDHWLTRYRAMTAQNEPVLPGYLLPADDD